MTRQFLILLSLLAVCLSFTSCKKKETATSVASKPSKIPQGEFRFINRGDIITLDMNGMSYVQDFRITFALREGLFTNDPQTLKPLMAIATSAEVTPDKKTWTFKLRDDAKWSNGDPVVAGDFVFSWKNLLEATGEYTYLFFYIDGAKAYNTAYAESPAKADWNSVGIKAPDDHTLIVQLTDPVGFMRELMAFPPFFPRHAKSMEPFKQTDATGHVTYKPEYTRPPAVVTNGPFKLVAWEQGRRLRLEKNENYWDKANVKTNAIEMLVNNDALGAFQMYESGDVDWLADPAADIASELLAKKRGDLRVGPAFGTAFLTVNCGESVPTFTGKNPLSDQRVRMALSMAIDKQAICDSITRMGEKASTTYVPPGIFAGYTPPPGYGFDIARAKKLMAEAGYPDGKGFPSIPLLFNTDNPTRKQFCEFLKNQWRENLGIEVELAGTELKNYRTLITTKNYIVAAAAWFGDYQDPSTFTDKYKSDSENNDSNWKPPEYDALLLKATKEPDEAKRLALLESAEKMINDELPIIPLYYYTTFYLARDNVKGLYMNPKQLTIWKPVTVER